MPAGCACVLAVAEAHHLTSPRNYLSLTPSPPAATTAARSIHRLDSSTTSLSHRVPSPAAGVDFAPTACSPGKDLRSLFPSSRQPPPSLPHSARQKASPSVLRLRWARNICQSPRGVICVGKKGGKRPPKETPVQRRARLKPPPPFSGLRCPAARLALRPLLAVGGPGVGVGSFALFRDKCAV